MIANVIPGGSWQLSTFIPNLTGESLKFPSQTKPKNAHLWFSNKFQHVDKNMQKKPSQECDNSPYEKSYQINQHWEVYEEEFFLLSTFGKINFDKNYRLFSLLCGHSLLYFLRSTWQIVLPASNEFSKKKNRKRTDKKKGCFLCP